MDDKMSLLPYLQKRSGSRSLSPRRSRTHEEMVDSRSHSKSAKYRDHKDVHRSMKAYSRSRSNSISRSKRYKSSKYESKRSRSRSRSPYRGRVSRSRSRTYSRYSRERSFSPHNHKRAKSRSPGSTRKRHVGSRDDPHPNRCLGVFGLSSGTSESQIYSIFQKYGPVEQVVIVNDAKTKRPKGYCFVYYESLEDARAAKEQCAGMEIEGRRIRVDYSITERAHTPTPGIYRGKVAHFHDGRVGGDWGGPRRRDYYPRNHYRGGGGYRGRSPSPYYGGGGGGRSRSRYERSRSRSYSPSPRRY